MYPARRVLEYAVITSFLLFNILMFGVPRSVFQSCKGKVENEQGKTQLSLYMVLLNNIIVFQKFQTLAATSHYTQCRKASSH